MRVGLGGQWAGKMKYAYTYTASHVEIYASGTKKQCVFPLLASLVFRFQPVKKSYNFRL